MWDAASSSPTAHTVIGIEVHAQLSIPAKLFSSAPTCHNPAFADAVPNMCVHPYGAGYPGTLPSLSLSAVWASLRAAAALQCRIHERSRFERKHYFYPDLPLGFQITQQRWPLASEGVVRFVPYVRKPGPPNKGSTKNRRRGGKSRDKTEEDKPESDPVKFEPKPVRLRIERIQIEQDTGKTTTHTSTDDNGHATTKSFVDYNRAGCALIEIVSHPDLRSAHEAAGVVERIRKLLKHVGACDGRMEEGSLRCDLNVSIAPVHDGDALPRTELPPNVGYRVEVKNLNSLRQIIAATEYEALRQTCLAQKNAPTGQETRTFHVKPVSDAYPLGGETHCIRAKGDAVDYRFMPEPDLPPLVLDEGTLGMSLEEFLEHNMPESPEEAKARLMKQYALTEDVAHVITEDPPAIALFEQAVATAMSEHVSTESDRSENLCLLATLSANWLCNDLFALVRNSALNHSISVEYSTVDGKRLGALVALIANGTLTTTMAKKVLRIMFEEDSRSSPKDIAKLNGWQVIKDMDALVELCESEVLDPRHSPQLEQYKLGGKKTWKIEKFFVGKIMAASKGNAHPEKLKEALMCVLEKINS